jgi:hypothetical protein
MRPLGPSMSELSGSASPKQALRRRIFVSKTSEVNKMDYLIVVGVVSMVALYALIIERCLRDAEWR